MLRALSQSRTETRSHLQKHKCCDTGRMLMMIYPHHVPSRMFDRRASQLQDPELAHTYYPHAWLSTFKSMSKCTEKVKTGWWMSWDWAGRLHRECALPSKDVRMCTSRVLRYILYVYVQKSAHQECFEVATVHDDVCQIIGTRTYAFVLLVYFQSRSFLPRVWACTHQRVRTLPLLYS